MRFVVEGLYFTFDNFAPVDDFCIGIGMRSLQEQFVEL